MVSNRSDALGWRRRPHQPLSQEAWQPETGKAPALRAVLIGVRRFFQEINQGILFLYMPPLPQNSSPAPLEEAQVMNDGS